MKKFILSTIWICLFASGQAQTTQKLSIDLNWEEGFRTHRSESVFAEKSIYFDGATYKSETGGLPIWQKRIKLNGPSEVRAQLLNVTDENFSPGYEDKIFDNLTEDVKIKVDVYQDRNEYYAFFSFIPLMKDGVSLERLISFDIEYTSLPKFTAKPRIDQPTISELSEGQLFKISVAEKGIFKIDANFITEQLGLSLSEVNPKKIKLLTTESGPLRPKVSDDRQADLLDYPLFFSGNDNAIFDQNEFFLFFTEGPTRVEYDEGENRLTTIANPFSFSKHFFIKIGADNGARMNTVNSLPSGEFQVSNFDDIQRFEEDKFNILFQEDQAQGTGQAFYGDLFNQVRSQDFNFNFPNINSNKPLQFTTEMALRGSSGSRYSVSVNGNDFQSGTSAAIIIGNAEKLFADQEKVNGEILNPTESINVSINYPAVGDGTNKAWLDYIEINANRNLTLNGNFMTFQNIESKDFNTATFNIDNTNGNTSIWDITNWDSPKIQETSNDANSKSWSSATEGIIKKYVAVNTAANFPNPNFNQAIENQNLHEIEKTDMVIIYHADFKSQAERLAEHRSNHNNITIELVNIADIWNEFSGGSIDPVGIRDFMKMIYDRDPNFKTLLLFGDGTFDYRNVYNAGLNFIPTFETVNSLHPINGYPTDDYFGLLDENEGANPENGLLDLGVGRIPCRTLVEATNVVNKIIHYDLSLDALGDWRNRMVFLGDDEDGNLHFDDSEELADSVQSKYNDINQVKIYLDAFQQEATSGGTRFPLANDAFNRNMFRGALAVNYFGHGGSQGWAQERVITQQDIGSWKNLDAMPMLITATCSFTGFDEPGLTSGGELCLLNPKGGAIALMSTTRAVFAQQNYNMVDDVIDSLVYSNLSIGEMLRIGKNKGGSSKNIRKFGVFGDPSLHLKVPPLRINTTSINGIPFDQTNGILDTLSALEKVTIEGVILDLNGAVNTSFKGRIYPTIFDKEKTVQTLGQDAGSNVASFVIRNSVVFKGKATVQNGKFTFSFIVPKDIDYEIGEGRISYYAEDGTLIDGRGTDSGFMVGGGANADLGDDQPPLVEVFMNEIPFANGGLTDENPVLLARLTDDFGINIAGQAVGHNLSAVLDNNTAESFLLNDFYEAELDDYTKGNVKFPLFDIAPGKHTITVKAWDVSNNSGEGTIEFFVAESGEIALDHVLNYPNPFTSNTSFQFEHNMNGRELDVQVQIFSVSGKLVKTIQERVLPEGSLVRDIQWNGTDDYGQQLAKGVYVYRVKVRNAETADLQTTVESDYEKLVILK